MITFQELVSDAVLLYLIVDVHVLKSLING